jgi:hypothetical protein
MKNITAISLIAGFTQISSAFSCQELNDTVAQLKASNEINNKDRLEKIKALAIDHVDHYDRAVVLGTSNPKYVCEMKESLFKSMVKNSDTKCSSINLTECINDLICNAAFWTNLDDKIFPCD